MQKVTFCRLISAYFPVTILPKMARSIRIREKSLSSNYLAIRNIFGQYFLNGQQRVAWPGTYVLGGATFKYKRPYNEPETLEADGPLLEELVLEVTIKWASSRESLSSGFATRVDSNWAAPSLVAYDKIRFSNAVAQKKKNT